MSTQEKKQETIRASIEGDVTTYPSLEVFVRGREERQSIPFAEWLGDMFNHRYEPVGVFCAFGPLRITVEVIA